MIELSYARVQFVPSPNTTCQAFFLAIRSNEGDWRISPFLTHLISSRIMRVSDRVEQRTELMYTLISYRNASSTNRGIYFTLHKLKIIVDIRAYVQLGWMDVYHLRTQAVCDMYVVCHVQGLVSSFLLFFKEKKQIGFFKSLVFHIYFQYLIFSSISLGLFV